MTDITITGGNTLKGAVAAPSSKAHTHRALVAALLSKGVSEINSPLYCDDTMATMQATEAFGARVELKEGQWSIRGVSVPEAPQQVVDCCESAASLRFMAPVAALAGGSSTFFMGKSLRRRPLAPFLRCLQLLGVKTGLRADGVLSVEGGGIEGGKTAITGNISSQFVSGLLFACPRARNDTELTITTPVESQSYIRITLGILAKHNIRVKASTDLRHFEIPPQQMYEPSAHKIPGDFSSAAFILAAAAVTRSKLQVKDLEYDTDQGDKIIVGLLKQMGSRVNVSNGAVEMEGNRLDAFDVDAKDIPDLVPVLAVLGCFSSGCSVIRNVTRLRYKESNRLSSICAELKKMGAGISADRDGLTVNGPCSMHGAIVDSHGDHRIAMACTVAALAADGKTIIRGVECVNKSYPMFLDDLHSLGANVSE